MRLKDKTTLKLEHKTNIELNKEEGSCQLKKKGEHFLNQNSTVFIVNPADRRNHPSRLLAEKNRDGQLHFNSHIEVIPGQHMLPAQVRLVEKQIANKANQDEEPRHGLQGHAQADRRSVSVAHCQQQGEAGKGQEDQRREQTEVNRRDDLRRSSSHRRHLRVEEPATGQHEGGQHLCEDEEEKRRDADAAAMTGGRLRGLSS